MATIKVAGIPPYDGEYEFEDDRPFNTREWRWIKKISGYMPFTISEGFAGGDPDLFVALCVIAMNRDGRIDREDAFKVAEDLAEAPFDGAAISFVGEQEEGDAGPPVLTSEPDESSPTSSLENPTSSGDSSTNGLEKSDETQPSTGASSSVTSFPGSPPAKLVK